jgi:hypothetical protein
MPTLVRSSRPLALHDSAATRRIEQATANALPPHALMQRAGLATARLALALAPHARRVWVAAAPATTAATGWKRPCTCKPGA